VLFVNPLVFFVVLDFYHKGHREIKTCGEVMHLIMLNLAYNPALTTPEALLEEYFSLTGWAEGVTAAGAEVTVFQRFPRPAVLEQAGVTYHFIADRYGPALRSWQHPWQLYRQVRRLAAQKQQAAIPVVIHFNGLLFPLQVGVLRRLPPPACPLVVQHHAERPWPAYSYFLQRWGLKNANAFLFTARSLADIWLEAGLISPNQPIYEVMETSSILNYEDRSAARALTGLTGAPILLWTGSLSPRKDPLTVLAGFELILEQLPGARLYMAYLYEDLLIQVQARIEASPTLRRSVTLLGRIPYGEIEAYYNSADLFVQGSHSEGSGIALLDALACGVIPVVTDIPSFRVITAGGRIGALWPPGDAPAFAKALLALATQPLAPLSTEAKRFFEENWHFSALGRRAVAVYKEVLERTNEQISRNS
jgi:glycosyltransferase involved in cell wall biosynthesis